MLGGIENLRKYRDEVAQSTPDHPDLSKLNDLIAYGERSMAEQAPTEAPIQAAIVLKGQAELLTPASMREQLIEELKSKGQEIALPEPSAALVEVRHILADKGFDVEPIVYVDRRKKEVTYAILERVVRPEYNGGIQMYYQNPGEEDTRDPLASILERGRGRAIRVESWTKHVPHKSRFGASWDEIHNYVAPQLVETAPHLAVQVEKGKIKFRVPTKSEFQFAGTNRYDHFGQANTWEWLYDNARSGRHLLGGRRDHGGLEAVDDWPSGVRNDYVGFRLQGSSPSQKLPR